MRFRYLFAVLLMALPIYGQTGRFDGVFSTTLQQNVLPGGLVNLATVPYASVQVCNYPAVQVPCTNLAVTYTDSTLSTQCPSYAQVTAAGGGTCTANTDSVGNWGFWANPGTYSYTFVANGKSYGPGVVVVPSSTGGVQFSPIGNQTITQPTATTFGTNSFNNVSYVSQANAASINTIVAAGGNIAFGPGNYVLTADLQPPSNTTITCSGWGVHFTMPGVAGQHDMFTIIGKSNITIQGCQLDGTGMTATTGDSYPIHIESSTNINIVGNWIHDIPEDGINLGPFTGTGPVTQFQIADNLIVNPGQVGPSGSCIGTNDANTGTVTGNTCITPSLDGFDFEPIPSGTTANFITVSGNTLIGKSGSSNGISFLAQSAGTAAHNTITGNTVSGFGGASGIYINGNTSDTISGNTVFANLTGLLARNTSNSVLGPNQYTSDTTGITLDGTGATGNQVWGMFHCSATGITETNSANGNDYNLQFSGNTANFGTFGSNSTATYSTGNGQRIQVAPSLIQNCNTVTSPTCEYVIPSAGAGAFNPIVSAGDTAHIYAAGFTIAPSSGSNSGIRWDSSGNSTQYGNSTIHGTFQIGAGYPIPTSNQPAEYVGTITTTAATSDSLSVAGLPSGAHCSAQAQDSTAAALTAVYVPPVASAGTVVLNHSATASGHFSIFCSFE